MDDEYSGWLRRLAQRERFQCSAHGRWHTHLDALNHVGFGGQWYSGFSVDDPDAPCVADLARHRLFTRGVLADNCDLGPAVRLARDTGAWSGGLVVAPPPLPKATGCLVSPLFIQ